MSSILSEYAPPSRNPADNDTLTGLLKLAFIKFIQSTDDMLPAQVVAFDQPQNSVSVQPLIEIVTTIGQNVTRGQIASIPVLQLSGGGFIDYFPINPGDYGWIKANDRDISLLKQTGEMSPPNTQRKHSFSDAIFIPQTLWSLITIASEDIANRVIQNYAGTVKIALWSNLIKILAPHGVGIGGTPHTSGILDLQSTTQALILPRMTTTQKLAIVSPVAGMMVWDTTEVGVSTYNGGAWS